VPDLRTYPTSFQAHQAAAFLRGHGVPAVSLNQISSLIRPSSSLSIPEWVSRAEAERLLEEYESQLPDLEPGWESQAIPDLSVLDPRLAPPCGVCSQRLPLDPAVTACPSCGTAVDVVERIIETHGPEALASCYPDWVDELVESQVIAAPLFCPQCDYPLEGLAPDGRCPECGSEYSKRAMIARLAGF